MTDHPCKGMTAAQRRWFEAIATGTHGSLAPKKVMAALLEKGVVEHTGQREISPGPMVVTIQDYAIPLGLHAQWCAWCAEQGRA